MNPRTTTLWSISSAVAALLAPKNAASAPDALEPPEVVSLAAIDDAGSAPWHSGAIGSARGSLGFSIAGGVVRWVGIDGSVVRWHVSLEMHVPFDRIAAGPRVRVPAIPDWYAAPWEDPMAAKKSFVSTRARWAAASALFPGAIAFANVALAKPSPPSKAHAPVQVVSAASGSTSGGAGSSTSTPSPQFPPPISASTAVVLGSASAPAPPSASAVRTLVDAAWRTAGLDREEATDDLVARARASALVPNLGLRVHRGLDVGGRVYSTADSADRSTTSDATQTFIEARLTWRLDRLVFADEEVSLERLRMQRAELKQKLATKIIDLTFRWHRARRLAANVDALPVEREEGALIAAESLVSLDAYTDGAASKLLSR